MKFGHFVAQATRGRIASSESLSRTSEYGRASSNVKCLSDWSQRRKRPSRRLDTEPNKCRFCEF
jgi:hypothetical protein